MMASPSQRMITLSAIFLLKVTHPSLKVNADTDVPECGLWLGPSSTKANEEHGFGLGMFTGKHISKNDVMPAELLVPIYDWDDTEHPPLREYLWPVPEGALTDMVLESLDSMLMFVPGLASIAPCTSVNYNLKLEHTINYEDWGSHRSDPHTPAAGAFSYRTNAMFTAVRDILPGEELVVQCEDDDFDAAAGVKKPHDSRTIKLCLDDTLEERPSKDINGKGLFTKRDITQPETVLLSTPMVPIHQDELTMEQERTQLLLNYCYGHPESVLLWLPHGPLINAINHDPSREPNARVQWHETYVVDDDDDYDQEDDEIDDDMDGQTRYDSNVRRLKFHHPELLEATPEEVAKAHGKGLVMDLVSTRAIAEGEEVLIDYGDAWVAAWEAHTNKWAKKDLQADFLHQVSYMSAYRYNEKFNDYEIRTVTQQNLSPYPANLQTACYFEIDWAPDADFQEDLVTYKSWNQHTEHHNCLLPCLVIESHGGDTDDDEADSYEGDDDGNFGETLYTAKLIDSHDENVAIDWNCHLYQKFEYIYTDIPREGIIFVEKPHRSDVWIPDAFRYPIGVPDTNDDKMYPDGWKKKQLRRRVSNRVEYENGHAFKRKNVVTRQDSLDAIRIKTEL